MKLRLSDLRIGTKLAIVSGVALLLICAMIGAEFVNNGRLKQSADLVRQQSEIALHIRDMQGGADGMQIAVRDLRLANAANEIEAAKKALDEHHANIAKNSDAVLAGLSSGTEHQEIQSIKALAERYYKDGLQVFGMKSQAADLRAKLVTAGSDTPTVIGKIRVVSDKLEKHVREQTIPLEARLDGLTNAASEAAEAKIDSELDVNASVLKAVERTGLVIGLIAAVILIGSAFLGVAGIAKPLRALVQPLDEVAHGNFAIEVPGGDRKDEIGQVAGAVAEMIEKVKRTVTGIKTSGREVTNASTEIATATTDLSQRTEEQAASLEETSAAMEELSSTVKKNAENAQHANQSANSTMGVADRGSEVVAQAVQAMAQIEESSRKISDIIGVIDEIARQTNLLALNAAVEAARAGEAGRGFAVVASEVRTLAQRSSQAAKDIKDLIINSGDHVKNGVELVNRAGGSLNEIVESIKSVASVVAEIANASAEQATGIEEINRALTQMDQATQQNSALVEENAATAKTLEHQAETMDEQIAFFRVSNEINLDLAVQKHNEWKAKLRTAITNQEKLDALRITSDSCCELGEWLHGDGQAKFGTKAEFQSVMALHKAFHAEAGRVSELINQGKYAEADQALADNTTYSKATVSVRSAIGALKKVVGA